jgi:hypothetical protein
MRQLDFRLGSPAVAPHRLQPLCRSHYVHTVMLYAIGLSENCDCRCCTDAFARRARIGGRFFSVGLHRSPRRVPSDPAPRSRRFAAEKRQPGIVRWLRPEFQNPSGVKQRGIAIEEDEVEAVGTAKPRAAGGLSRCEERHHWRTSASSVERSQWHTNESRRRRGKAEREAGAECEIGTAHGSAEASPSLLRESLMLQRRLEPPGRQERHARKGYLQYWRIR